MSQNSAYSSKLPLLICLINSSFETKWYSTPLVSPLRGALVVIDIEYIKLLLSHEHSFTEGLCECGYINRVWLNTNFDLTDRKIFSSVTLEDEFADDLICLTLRHTTTYVILSKEYFGIDCITKVEYLSSEPPSHFYEEGNEHLLASYNQIVFLHITPQSKERMIEIIKELETLEFVRSASPDYKISIGDVRSDN